MGETWNISLVGIIFALGGLGLIATFFAIVGHFFKKNALRKKTSKSISSPTIIERKKTIQYTTEKSENIEKEEEVVAAISATIMAYAPAGGKIVSIKRMNERKKDTRHLWRLHNAQTTWRIKESKKGAITR